MKPAGCTTLPPYYTDGPEGSEGSDTLASNFPTPPHRGVVSVAANAVIE
jgi:hypothetical protein